MSSAKNELKGTKVQVVLNKHFFLNKMCFYNPSLKLHEFKYGHDFCIFAPYFINVYSSYSNMAFVSEEWAEINNAIGSGDIFTKNFLN